MTREELLASLQIAEHDSYTLGERSYLDWSVTDADGLVSLEVGDEQGDVAQLHMTSDEIAELHHRLTVWLLDR